MNQKIAHEIMGTNFVGFEEVKCLPFNLPDSDQIPLEDVPFSEGLLQERSTTHVLFIGLPLTLSEIVNRWPEAFYCEDHHLAHQLSRDKRLDCRWYLMSKDVPASTLGASWSQQQRLLVEKEEAPLASEVAIAAAMFRLTRRVFLYSSAFTRCRDTTESNGQRAVVGYNGDNGMYLRLCRDSYRGQLIGLASSLRI
jgi:hypothetical protein